MKKILLVLVFLFMLISVPSNVKAYGLVYREENGEKLFDCEKPVTEGGKKTTKCAIKFENDTTEEWSGVMTLTLEPFVVSTEGSFKIASTKVAKLDATKTDEDEGVYVFGVEPIPAGKTVTLGTVTWIADPSVENCGGKIIPSYDKTEPGEIGGGEIPETGYAIPYVALAVGAVGVITVLATSKKKTKMYKI